MDIDWSEYRSQLRRFFFGTDKWKLADRDSSLERSFFVFLAKLQQQLSKRNRKACKEEPVEPECDHLGVPVGPFQRHFTSRVAIDVCHKDDLDLRHLADYVVREFVYALACFVLYENKKKLNQLRQLRAAQRNLPIAAKRESIIDALLNNQVVIIAGDTGCGKSTQVPQYLLEADYDRVACTQPRRIAATTLARRVAYETLDEYGSKIAYQIRFERTSTLRTRLLFLTEGLLLRQMQLDPDLTQYSVIILDEVHERNLSGDFLMGLLRELVRRRIDLKLILMSATINLDLFTSYFDGAPVIKVCCRFHSLRFVCVPSPERRGGIA
ncbi:unnamed protein product [Toxocara canis]|uniref:Helicase ATP-binding domain-containing protein n=1 Tax=Toxocara canis TaxID=6265 RepID=A0A183V686_TOXCA|nr:unnamed protein product [Toxocara canis]